MTDRMKEEAKPHVDATYLNTVRLPPLGTAKTLQHLNKRAHFIYIVVI